MLVLEVDDLPRGGSPGLVLRELVYDCCDPAMLPHCRALVMEIFFCAMDELSRDTVSTSLDAWNLRVVLAEYAGSPGWHTQ
jgi:hypothetical protein